MSHPHPDHAPTTVPPAPRQARRSVLAWPAWLRVAAVLPLVGLLWWAVAWAQGGVAPW